MEKLYSVYKLLYKGIDVILLKIVFSVFAEFIWISIEDAYV